MAYVPEDLIECSICNKRFEDPHSLPCSHVFCRVCITNWLNRSNICPLCRKSAAVGDLKKSFVLNEIVCNVRTDDKIFCDNCKQNAELSQCDHCNKSICSSCLNKHTDEIKMEVSRLCDELISVTTPDLESHNETIALLMSEATNAKHNLTNELREVHDMLVTQIYDLRQKSLDMLKETEKMSQPDLNVQIEEIESLIARIDTFTSSSAKIIERKDLKDLVQLDIDITQLQKDIDEFQLRQKNVYAKTIETPLKNLKINPLYRWIANVIEETDMLRKTDMQFLTGP